jgi:hypothetical protein
MRYLTGFKVFESRDSGISELINEITSIVNDILLELNFEDIEGECRSVKINNRFPLVPSHYIIINLKKESELENLTWNEVSDVMDIASDYLKDNNFIYSVEKTINWGTGVDRDSNPQSIGFSYFGIMTIYFKYEGNIS